MKQFLFSTAILSALLLMVSCASSPSVHDDEIVVKVSRDASNDDIAADDEMSLPVWANDMLKYKREAKNKKKPTIWYASASRVTKKHNLSTCYNLAKVEVQKELSESIKTAVDSSFAKTVRGEVGGELESYAEGVIGAASKSIASGLKLKDRFWAKVMNKKSNSYAYDCYVLYGISEKDFTRSFDLSTKKKGADIPADREAEMKAAMKRAREQLTN
jgi:hypothetical protein